MPAGEEPGYKASQACIFVVSQPLKCVDNNTSNKHLWCSYSLVSRPHPVFHRLQYGKVGESLVSFLVTLG